MYDPVTQTTDETQSPIEGFIRWAWACDFSIAETVEKLETLAKVVLHPSVVQTAFDMYNEEMVAYFEWKDSLPPATYEEICEIFDVS